MPPDPAAPTHYRGTGKQPGEIAVVSTAPRSRNINWLGIAHNA
jgi:hypothetical protein